jgi:DNA (cytosine-5)-methyltransferase 1
MRPILIDTFCGGGGCSVGYDRAGFDVVGVDLYPQKNYPFDFLQMDALEALRRLLAGEYLRFGGRQLCLADIAVIHASPPCQAVSALAYLHNHKKSYREKHVNQIPAVRELLLETEKPFVIENVAGSRRHMINPITLCGTMFGLKTDYGNQLIRHRLFETSPVIWFPPTPCGHNREFGAIGVYGGGQHPDKRKTKPIYGRGHEYNITQRRTAMGIDWMTGKELNQAIPPAYTEYIGSKLLEMI